MTAYSNLPPAGQYHPAGNSTYVAPNLLFGPLIDVNRLFILFKTVIQCARNLFHLLCEPHTKKAKNLRSPRLPGLETAWEPILRCPEPKAVIRNPHFCVVTHLLSRRTASQQSAVSPLKASLQCQDQSRRLPKQKKQP